jgi:hypothetical protein
MIRFLSISAAVVLALIVLYLPAANPPERFIAQMRHEHEINIDFWGAGHAHRILARMLDFQAALSDTRSSTLSPTLASTAAAPAADKAVADEMSRVSERLTNNQYFRSIETLMALAMYRFAVLVEWLPVALLLLFTLLFDGFAVRAARSKEFVQHNPEMFGLCSIVLIVAVCATLIAFVLPATIHPLLMCTAMLMASLAGRGIVANYHRRA